MRAVIVEDTFTALEELKALLQDNHPEVDIVGHAATEPAAVDLLRRERPAVVFMDIKLLGGGDGFRVVEQAHLPELQVIFVSDYSEMALRAFRFDNVVDFLAKPVDESELAVAVRRAKTELKQRRLGAAVEKLQDKVQNPAPRIALSDQTHIIFPYIHSIVHIEAEREATQFFFDTQPAQMLVSKNIGGFRHLTEKHPQWFVQTHRSHIVNVTHVMKFLRFERTAVLSNGDAVPVSNEFLKSFLKALNPDA